MRNGYYNVVATMLLVMNFERTRSVQDLCGLCPAGTFCGKSKNQTCIPCPSNSYSSTGGQRACNICTKCEGVVKKPCSFTSDTECDCISGFHCLGAGCAMCDPDCKPGQELTADGRFAPPVSIPVCSDLAGPCRLPQGQEAVLLHQRHRV
uniref:TNFR-Cys domain-containing protein n=1 Tax=Spermophilus dauricus TaxID=99837 RepID=A0A8C9UWR9_SPEDA